MIGYDNTGVRHNCFADNNHVIGSVGKGKTNGAVFIDLHSVHELELFAVRVIVIKVCGQPCIFRGGTYSQYRMEIERPLWTRESPMTVPVVLRAEARMISASGMLPVSGVTPMSMPFASSATILLPLIVQLMLFPMLRITSISFPRIEDMASSYKTVLFFISMVTFLAGAVGAALLSEVLSAGFCRH